MPANSPGTFPGISRSINKGKLLQIIILEVVWITIAWDLHDHKLGILIRKLSETRYDLCWFHLIETEEQE
jgi:hypothetical protein